MKSFDTTQRIGGMFRMFVHVIVATVILSLGFHPSSVRAEAPQRQRTQSLQERAMNAAQQLREYHHRVANEAANLKLRGLSKAPAEVGIKINREMKTSSTIFFYDNMESGINGWATEAYTGSDLWHQSTLNAGSPTHSWWAGVENQSNYVNGTRINNALKSPSIDLTSAVAPLRLLFTENYMTELGWDYCIVDVSTDGGTNWTHLRGGYGSAPSGDNHGWQIAFLDLSPYAGQTIMLRFFFDTGDEKFNDFPGWFVDDVVIFDQSGIVTGKKFFDVNNNSQKDIGERGVKNWLITATGPIALTTKTNYRGRYSLPLPLGTYTVSETFQPNWTQTYPLSGTWTVNLTTPDTLVDSIHFGNYIHASFIRGKKFHDLNKNDIFDGGDTLLPEWKIILADTDGNEIDFDRTDSLGEYELYVFTPGRYVVHEVQKSGWIQSYPPSESYTIDIPDLSTIDSLRDFGNYYSPLTNAIIGQKFNDRNRNRAKDNDELGVSGFKIQLMRKNGTPNFHNYRQRTTDSSGYYTFLSLPADTYKVLEIPQRGWWQSYPDSFYILPLNSGDTQDSIDFGNFEFLPGTVSGMKYNDLNGNGAKDGGETGLPGWRFDLNGTTYYGATLSQSVTTDPDGNYSMTGIWPGTYTVSEVFRNNWRQTQPPSLNPYFITLGLEENRSDVDFGNIQDSTFSLSFRTFKPESLALGVDKKGKHKPIPLKPYTVQFWDSLYNDAPDSAFKVKVRFVTPYLPGTLTVDPPGTITPIGDKFKVIEITFSTYIPSGGPAMICGFTKKVKDQFAERFAWTYNDSTHLGGRQTITNIPRLPMPNTINFLQGIGNGLRVGLGGPHSVVHLTYKDVIKSLIDKHGMHIGDARCIDKFSSLRSIKKQQKYLTPTQHNNKLFAEAIAFRENIIGSDLGYIPGGFGNLVFDEGTGGANPMNGLSLREVAARLDSFMSSYKDTGAITGCYATPSAFTSMDPETLYAKVREINCAFSGPLDTVSFATGLKFTDVKALADVSFLRLDPRAAFRTYVPSYSEMNAIPEQYTLYQNYPNPFNPTTVIEFYLPEQSIVTLKIYNTLGQEVASIFDRQLMDDGSQQIEFNAANLPSGVYFYR
ncbi:MAG: immune inhibitor A, partial [Ignavibacteria bacterium]|nr:immune inhibitor A [Ignavibacteria bacterium]